MTIDLVANYTSATVDPRQFAAAAEAAGFDGVGMSDHLFRTTAYPHVWVAVSAMAQATERVFLTTSFANNLLRSPVEFAQASLTMQWLSGGRFEAGLGAGWLESEVRAVGLEYPPASARARRYREAIQIVSELFRTGSCRFEGEHYTIDVPVIGPTVEQAPPLVASLGGPWTIANIAPLVDRVELKFGASTRGGDLDLGALATATRDDLRRMVGAVRDVAPDTPIGVFAMIAVGGEVDTAPLRASLGDGLYAEFVGEPGRVLDNLRSLEQLGVDRVQVTERLKGSIERLGNVS
jgi:alkanesulfonate monooxygenase SsuD/methylene tetrahydromethanopterin reductase-like flavin-dependent oxidoreductase (luciferase family)